MSEFLLQYESNIRAGLFITALLLMLLWEWRAPCRAASVPKRLRAANHLALLMLGTVVVRAVCPMLAVAAASIAAARGWGLFQMLDWPAAVEIMLAVLLLDVAIYGQHRLFHAVPFLWRMHRVHHSDMDFDVTTALRFHPAELLLSMMIKIALVMVLGPAAIAVLIFEVLLNVMAMFNHGNVRLPKPLERRVRRVVVTPDMHRIHHSVDAIEVQRNFGFNLSCWDHLFGSYQAQPSAGHQTMSIGQAGFRSIRGQWLDRLLSQPWR